MAVTLGKSPIIITAVGDTVGGDASVPASRIRLKEPLIRVVTAAAGGDVVLLDKLGGQEVWRSNSMAANSIDSEILPGNVGWIDGLYVSALPAGAKIFVYYG